VGSYSADVTVLIALAVLVIAMRWIFKPSRPRRGPLRRPADASDATDLGMLTVIAMALPRAGALEMRARLGDEQIRSSMSRRRDGRYDVLVFDTDVDRARALLN
jgi:hypothetical protein